jgi:hypothetical protein
MPQTVADISCRGAVFADKAVTEVVLMSKLIKQISKIVLCSFMLFSCEVNAMILERGDRNRVLVLRMWRGG